MLKILVTNPQQTRHLEHVAGPLEFGRSPSRGNRRVVLDDPHVSRDQLRIRERSGARLEVENLSGGNALYLADGTSVPPGEQRELTLPVRITAGTTLIEITTPMAEGLDSWQTICVPRAQATLTPERLNLAEMGSALTPETLAHWFETVISVQRAAAGSPEFYAETARAVVELIGLDRGMVLLRSRSKEMAPDGDWQDDEDAWHIVASHSIGTGDSVEFSRTVLRRIVEARRTFFRGAETSSITGSLMNVEAVVASPIFDAQGEVTGAVYGLRALGGPSRHTGIRPLEAQLVQLLAAAVGSGLARLRQEAEAARSRVQFEQFFSTALAEELQRDPALLDGRDREVTILFSDIYNFSSLSERLGPAETCRLVGDVMDQLTERIAALDGVIVDYQGDGLLAMWNAPADQPNHAELACRAALSMLDALTELNRIWQPQVGTAVALGIGLNTGEARVGNTGSRRRFKYGPLGHTVNLASRVQGATKHLGVPLLVTGSTRERLGPEFATRRLCRARLLGMACAVDLHELHGTSPDQCWLSIRDAYEHGLSLYESGRWAEACDAIYPVVGNPDGRYDVPSLTVIGRAVECLKSPPGTFDPVFEFGQK